MESQSCQETVRKKGVCPDARDAKVACTGRHCEHVDQVLQLRGTYMHTGNPSMQTRFMADLCDGSGGSSQASPHE